MKSNITRHFQKYHNTLCLPSKRLHKYCFYFLLGSLEVPRETGNNAYAKFWRANKEYYLFLKVAYTANNFERLGKTLCGACNLMLHSTI